MRCSLLLLALLLVVVVTTEATRDTDRQLFSICSSAEVENTVSIIDRKSIYLPGLVPEPLPVSRAHRLLHRHLQVLPDPDVAVRGADRAGGLHRHLRLHRHHGAVLVIFTSNLGTNQHKMLLSDSS